MDLPSADEVMRRWRVSDIAQTLLPRLRAELAASAGADEALRGQQHGGILDAADALEHAAGLVAEICSVPGLAPFEHGESVIESNADSNGVVAAETTGLDIWTSIHAGQLSGALDLLHGAKDTLSVDEQRDIRESICALAKAASLLDSSVAEAVRVLMQLSGKCAADIILEKAVCLWDDNDRRSSVIRAVCSVSDAFDLDPAPTVLSLARDAIPAECLAVSASLVADGRGVSAAKVLFDAWWSAKPRPLDICALLDLATDLIQAFPPRHGHEVTPPQHWMDAIAAECDEALATCENPDHHMLLLRHLMPSCPITATSGISQSETMPSFVRTNLPRLAKL